jgi:hypothetical protein
LTVLSPDDDATTYWPPFLMVNLPCPSLIIT